MDALGICHASFDSFTDELQKIAEEKHHLWHGSAVDYKPHLSDEELNFVRRHLPHAEERMHYQTPGPAKGAIAGGVLAGLPTAIAVGMMVGAQHGVAKGLAAGLVGLGVGTAVGAALGAAGARRPDEKEVHLQARELVQEAGKHKHAELTPAIEKLAVLELQEFTKTADLASREYMRGPISETPKVNPTLGAKLNKALEVPASYLLPVGGGALAGGLMTNAIDRIRGASREKRRKHTAIGALVGGGLGAAVRAAAR